MIATMRNNQIERSNYVLIVKGVTICSLLVFCFGTLGSQADSTKAVAPTGSGASSMLMGTLMRYFDPSILSGAAATNGEQSKIFANWSPNDNTRKQQILRDLISKASGLGAVMNTPDKVLRAELSMMQDLIKMSTKMIQNPIGATIDVPMDFAVLMSRMANQVEQ